MDINLLKISGTEKPEDDGIEPNHWSTRDAKKIRIRYC
jgi:hypothetical protein